MRCIYQSKMLVSNLNRVWTTISSSEHSLKSSIFSKCFNNINSSYICVLPLTVIWRNSRSKFKKSQIDCPLTCIIDSKWESGFNLNCDHSLQNWRCRRWNYLSCILIDLLHFNWQVLSNSFIIDCNNHIEIFIKIGFFIKWLCQANHFSWFRSLENTLSFLCVCKLNINCVIFNEFWEVCSCDC